MSAADNLKGGMNEWMSKMGGIYNITLWLQLNIL